MQDTTLVTGALGCIGAWTLRNLVRAGRRAVAFDLGEDRRRLRLIMSDDEIAHIEFVRGDITDFAQVDALFEKHAITHVVHLAGLQVPFCRANPVLGAQVNVVGTVNIFEAARRRTGQVERIVYASSAAVYDVDDAKPGEAVAPNASGHPATLYGVYKQANEGTARIYFTENGVCSIGLRPYIVYGPARDQGMTSAPTKAMFAAAMGQPFHIPYGGRADYEYADDVAKTFLACASAEFSGAEVFNLPGAVLHMRELIAAIEAVEPASAGRITFDDKPLPFPEELDGSPLDALLGGVPRRPLVDAVRETIAVFRDAVASGRMKESE
ncbi:MAG: NAD(P)-dependent oxidoreductase [Chloroflexi bacterium]|nr:NAD(P)-dependent oxidoreductase [Chloroflexota bacterium]